MPIIPLPEIKPPLVAALDVGSSSARAILYDGLGRSVEGLESRVPYSMSVSSDGGVEIDADHLLEIIFQSLEELLARFSDSGTDTRQGKSPKPEIAAVAVCTLWHSLMGVDGEGRALTPLYSWNDTRASSAARQLRDQLSERDYHARTGCMLHASYWPARLVWLRQGASGLFNRVSRWVSIGEYLYLRLFGRAVCSVSMASATGLFNQNQCGWDEKTISHLDINPDRLSSLAGMGAGVERLGGKYAARWPALANALWFPALGDGACGNIGSGCMTRDRAALMIGTSGALRVLWEAGAVNIPRGLWCYRADRRRFVMGGALSNGGNLFEWLWNTLRLGPVEEVEARLARMEPDAHGLTVLPFLSGERSTGWSGDARAAIAGLSLDNMPLDIMRAAIESVAYRFAAIYDILVEEIGVPREIIASGGAVLRSPAWAQIISDVLGKQITVSAEAETSSRGAALMALEALGAISGVESVQAAPGHDYFPDLERHERYLQARARQRHLYDALIGSARDETLR